MTGNIAQQANLTDMPNGTPPLYRTFWEAGFSVFGLHGVLPDRSCACGNSSCRAVLKHPRVSNWQHTPHWSEEQLARMEAMGQFKTGYGILCRIDDEFDLLVVDVDARNGGLEAYDRLQEIVPEVDGAGLIVNTGSGGGSRHMYFKVPKGAAQVTKHPDYKGIDFKSGSAFVVGPGSLHASGNYYEVLFGGPEDIEEAPEELVKLLQKPERYRADPGNRSGDVSNADLADMVRYITGFDDYDAWVCVGMALHHASGGTAIDVWDKWSQQSTKYDKSEITTKWHSFGKGPNPVKLGTLIYHAKQGGWKQPMTITPHVEFDFPEKNMICPSTFYLRDPKLIPPRDWLYGQHLVRDFPSLTVAPGGVGKSSMVIVEALSMASGRGLLGTSVPRPLKVWYWNGEDPEVEIERRVAAACIHYGLSNNDFADRFLADSGRDLPIRLVEPDRQGVRVAEPTVEALISAIVDNQIDVLIVDPFVTTHGASENDTTGMNAVVSTWRRIAHRANCAIELVHHVSKAGALNGDEIGIYASRGAGALIDGVRSARYCTRMTERDATKFVLDDNPAHYFRVMTGKANLAPADKASWMHMIGVPLGNQKSLLETGDTVGVCTPWTPVSVEVDLEPDITEKVKAALSEPARESERANNWVGNIIAEVLDLDIGPNKKAERNPDQSNARGKVRAVLAKLLREGHLQKHKEHAGRDGRDVYVIRVTNPTSAVKSTAADDLGHE